MIDRIVTGCNVHLVAVSLLLSRLLRVPLVFRMDQESDNNNKRCMQLLGHPSLLALPSRLRPATLTRTLAPRIPAGTQYSLLFVDGRVSGNVNINRCPIEITS